MSKVYDCIIIGGGPAGLSAGIYAARAKMDTLILEKGQTGGQIVTTDEVANYPGAIAEATGPSLVARMVEQAKEFGVAIKRGDVQSLELEGDVKVIKTKDEELKTKTVILATGATPRKLGVPGEAEMTGRGVSYCATCDGDFFTGLDIFVIGGGDTAVEEAIFLSKFGKKVTVVHRRDELRAAKSIQEKAFANEKIEFLYDTVVEEVKGSGLVEGLVVKNVKTGEVTELNPDENDGTFGIFILVGNIPLNGLFKDLIDVDASGYVITDSDMRTNIPGVYAAGDIRSKSLRQVITAAADGAIAAVQAEKYIEGH